jgi:hypothetical protein
VLMSSPVVPRDGHSVLSGWALDEVGVANQAWLLFAGPHPIDWSEIVLPDTTTLIPTLTADGRILTLAKSGVTAWRTSPRVEGALVASMRLVGIPAAPATSSRNHVFISVGNALLTFDANTFQRVAYKVTVPGGNVVFHPQDPFSNQGTSPVFHTTPAFLGGGVSQPGAAPK